MSQDSRLVEPVVYSERHGTGLRLLVTKPDSQQALTNAPCIIWIHGGGWKHGSADMMLPHCRYTADRGAVGISVQYRLIGEDRGAKTIGDCIKDCTDALRYIFVHSSDLGIDTSRVCVVGDSSGGHLAACLGVGLGDRNNRPAAAVVCNGITDLTGQWITFTGDDLTPQESAREWSPIFNIREETASFLVLHGDSDTVVAPAMSQHFVDRLRENGCDVVFKVLKGAEHAFIVTGYTASDEQVTTAMLEIDAFLVARGLLDGPSCLRMP